ncbi:MAG: hypothetical protein CM15mP125_2050 [Gammaproteobacteria bacterium]|nr:MAG: hypothetical protein CM15mP125_2050 [Gammaproteobacteria bacterium]
MGDGRGLAKTLRGESMTDVIFNGTTSRQPVSQASIELVFDNAQGKVAVSFGLLTKFQCAGWSPGRHSRVLPERGEVPATRHHDLFLGTGLGPRSYAIIEQGVVSRLIESKPEELRVFLKRRPAFPSTRNVGAKPRVACAAPRKIWSV